MRGLLVLMLLVGGLPVAVAQDAPVVPPEAPAAPEPRLLREKVAVFTSIEIAADEVVRGDVTCVGGDAVIAGRVDGDLVVVGGSLDLTGTVDGELVAVGSTVTFGPDSAVDRDVVTVLSQVDDQGLSYRGERVNVAPFFGIPTGRGAFRVFASMLGWFALLSAFVVFVVVLAFVALAPERVLELSERLRGGYLRALFIGLLVHATVVVLMPLLAITVIGIPILLLLLLGFWLLRILGRTALFHAVGAGIGRGFGREMSVAGATLLGFVPWVLLLVLPFFFGLAGVIVAAALYSVLKLLVDCPAIGGVVDAFLQTRREGRAAPPPPAFPGPSPPLGAFTDDPD